MTRSKIAATAAGVTLAVGAGISGLLVTLGSGEQAEYPAPVVTPLQLADCGETPKVINFCWEINPPDGAPLGEAYRFDAYTVDPDDPTKVTVKTSWTHDINRRTVKFGKGPQFFSVTALRPAYNGWWPMDATMQPPAGAPPTALPPETETTPTTP